MTTAAECLDLLRGLEKLLAAAGVERPDPAGLEQIAGRVARLGPTVVVALAGGTGAGKSSLLNALAGEPLAAVKVTRPTTEQPLAWAPVDDLARLQPYLAQAGITQLAAHRSDWAPHLALIDLPDFDSVETAHRETVDRLLPWVDAFVWVTDADKYADRVWHEAYLRRYSHQAGRFLIVLNKADRLEPGEEKAVRADLARLLREDGLSEVPVLSVSARTSDGVEPLRRELASRLEAKAVNEQGARAELARRLAEVEQLAGLSGGTRESLAEPRLEHAARIASPQLVSAAQQMTQRIASARSGGPLLALLGLVRSPGSTSADVVPWLESALLAGRDERLNEVTAATRSSLAALPAPWRPQLRELVSSDQVEAAVDAAIERATSDVRARSPRPPTRFWWRWIGVLSWIGWACLVIAAVAIALNGIIDAASSPDVPVLVGAGLFLAFLPPLLARRSARATGKRWAERLQREATDSMRADLQARLQEMFRPAQARYHSAQQASTAARACLGSGRPD